ncbi:hypothetical protein DL95DRAFT_129912 [Leptodontidium sp. 2 PMI_412]|nr:hypothetical protein DL95DRAFT_129912 [Leptodontidium sp. 2 PMI_412]
MTSANANLPDVNKGPAILAVCGTMTLLALVVVCMRIFVRTKFVHKLGLDVSVLAIYGRSAFLTVSGLCYASRHGINNPYKSFSIPFVGWYESHDESHE